MSLANLTNCTPLAKTPPVEWPQLVTADKQTWVEGVAGAR